MYHFKSETTVYFTDENVFNFFFYFHFSYLLIYKNSSIYWSIHWCMPIFDCFLLLCTACVMCVCVTCVCVRVCPRHNKPNKTKKKKRDKRYAYLYEIWKCKWNNLNKSSFVHVACNRTKPNRTNQSLNQPIIK